VEENNSPLEEFLKTYSKKTGTPETYRKYLYVFFQTAEITPKEFAQLVENNPKQAKLLCHDVLRRLEDRYAPKSLATLKSALNQFLEYLEAPFKVKLKGLKPVAQSFDYIPAIEEIDMLIAEARIELKPIIALMAFSGMRLGDVLQLKFENIASDIEYAEEENKYRVKRVPAKIIVFQEKTGRHYVTFMGPKCANVVVTYLNFVTNLRKRPFRQEEKLFNVTKGAFELAFLRLVRRCGIKTPPLKRFRAHSLRKYFRNRLLAAGVSNDLAEYLMGHVRGIISLTAIYTGLRDLSESAVEELRKKFAEAVPVLEGVEFAPKQYFEEVDKLKKELEETKRKLEIVLRAIDSSFNYLSREDLKEVWKYIGDLIYQKYREDLRAEYEEVAEIVANLKSAKKPEPVSQNNSSVRRRHIIVQGEEELLKYIDMGYELVKELSNNRYILRAPK